MHMILIVSAFGWWATAGATPKKPVGPSCTVHIVGRATAFILELGPTANALGVDDVVAAVAPFGLQIEKTVAFVPLEGGARLLTAIRLDGSQMPFPTNSELGRSGISAFFDPRPWVPGASRSLASLELAKIKSYRELSECDVTLPGHLTAAEAKHLLHQAGAVFVRGEPTAVPGEPWPATVLMSPTTLKAVGIAANDL